MKTILIKPYKKTIEIIPPLGLAYLAGSIRGLCDVEIINCIKENLKIKDLINQLKNKEFDVIGFQVFTEDLINVREIIKNIRIIKPNAIIIIRGCHPTLIPEQALDFLKPDYCFIGEAEESLRKFIEGVNPKDIEGIAFKQGNKTIINPKKLIQDLDKYKPAWDLLDLKNYPVAPHGSYCKQTPSCPIMITRGCPFNCSYCGATKISGPKIRSHSVDYVINQIELLVKRYGIREIHIEDDNFTFKKEFVKEFCNKLIEKNFGITWLCPNGVRLDTLDEELLLLMKKSGLVVLYVGIESGSDRIRKHMHKNLSTTKIREKIKLIRKCKIEVVGFFIIGYPEETLEDIDTTVKLSLELDLKRATFNAFKPIPNTDIYKELLERGEINNLNYNDYNYDKFIYSPKNISLKELEKIRKRALMGFYLRPKQFYLLLRDILNFRNIKSFIRRFTLLIERK